MVEVAIPAIGVTILAGIGVFLLGALFGVIVTLVILSRASNKAQ